MPRYKIKSFVDDMSDLCVSRSSRSRNLFFIFLCGLFNNTTSTSFKFPRVSSLTWTIAHSSINPHFKLVHNCIIQLRDASLNSCLLDRLDHRPVKRKTITRWIRIASCKFLEHLPIFEYYICLFIDVRFD